MTMPWPVNTRLLRDTDLFIRDLAYAADTALSTVVKMYVASGSQTTDANGDIIIDFGVPVTLTGILALPRAVDVPPPAPAARLLYGKVANYPPPYAAYQTPPTAVLILPREFVAGQGKVWCRCSTAPVALTASGNERWYGSQPVRAGSTVKFTAFGWSV